MSEPSFYDIQVTTIDGQTVSLDDYKGRTLLVVNVASRCGFTPQYAGLEALYRRHKDQGLVVLGFPCDQFGHQEPGTGPEIQQFCLKTYGITFPLFAKIKVNGFQTHPLYAHLKAMKRGLFGLGVIPWNFTKFLVDRNGEVVQRYSSRQTPEAIEKDLARWL